MLYRIAGVLYFGDTAANNVKASDVITELESKQQLADFVSAQPEKVLTVVNVSLLRCGAEGCKGKVVGSRRSAPALGE
jgi:hypothetical protein